jgi:hypothetical protein
MTHSDVLDPTLRSMYAKELLTIRRVCWNLNKSPRHDDFFYATVMGIDTVFRRMQFYLCTDVTLEKYLEIPLATRRNIAN